jgi:pimeloyl-ACP methyl ester carboxylesterase
LHAGLVKLGETEVVWVAFSAGGLATFDYLAKYAEPRVVGIVWVEGDTFTPTGESVFANDGGSLPLPMPLMRVLIEMGIGRLFHEQTAAPMERQLILERHSSDFDWDYYDRVVATRSTVRALNAAMDNVENYPDDLRYTASLTRSINVPVFALDADWAPRFVGLSEQAARTLRENEAIRAQVWRQMAEDSPGGRYIPVTNSGHYIPLEQAQAVIAAITDMVNLARFHKN